MAQLTKEDFEAKWTGNSGVGALFKDNITRDIVASRLRDFADDIADSFLLSNSGQVESWKSPCRVATTGNITLSGTQTIDTVSCSNGDRVLVFNQTDQTENGIYVMASGAWSRATDSDSAGELEGAAVAVQEGATYFNRIFLQTTDGISLGSSSIVWVLFDVTSEGDFWGLQGQSTFLDDVVINGGGSNTLTINNLVSLEATLDTDSVIEVSAGDLDFNSNGGDLNLFASGNIDFQGDLTGVITSGTYTPTTTNTTNITTSTPSVFQYLRVGNTVNVSGLVTVTPTGTGLVELRFTLPIATNIIGTANLCGTCTVAATNPLPGYIFGQTTGEQASLVYNAADTSARAVYVIFTYLIQ